MPEMRRVRAGTAQAARAPAMNRRTALRSLFAVPGVVGVASVSRATPADEHVYKGHRIRWSGWRDVPNQFVTFGFWVAHGNETRYGQPVFRYATTLGVSDVAGDCEQLRTDNPWGTFNPEPADRDALKARAMKLLYDHL